MSSILLLVLVLGIIFSQNSDGESNVVSSNDQSGLPVSPIVGTDAWHRYDSIFKKYATIYNLDWKWLKAFALNESLLATDRRTAKGEVSSDGLSWGLMQVTVATARDLLGYSIEGTSMNDPDLSVSIASKLIRQLSDRFGEEDVEAIVSSYNEGPGNYEKGKTVDEYYSRWTRWLLVVRQNP